MISPETYTKLVALIDIQEQRARTLDHCVDGTIYAAAAAILRGILIVADDERIE